MTNVANYITPAGAKKLRDELHQLLHIDRPETVKVVTWAASLGDRSENADYIYGKRRLREIDRRIHFLEKRLEEAVIIDPKTQVSNKIKFGATVTVEDEDGKSSIYAIVGVDESDPNAGKISWQSPLAKSLFNKSTGDTIVLQRPKGAIELSITAIEYKEI